MRKSGERKNIRNLLAQRSPVLKGEHFLAQDQETDSLERRFAGVPGLGGVRGCVCACVVVCALLFVTHQNLVKIAVFKESG